MLILLLLLTGERDPRDRDQHAKDLHRRKLFVATPKAVG
jgi:hypothetical protein